MSKYKEKMGDILNKIKGNKRVMYLTSITVLILFCLALNITFAKYTSNINKQNANITIGNLDYLFSINADYEEYKSNIINDRIIKSNPNSTLIFYVDITSLNKIDSKYQLLYDYCENYDNENNTCTVSSEQPEDAKIYYAMDSDDLTEDIIEKNSTKRIKIVIYNQSSNTYYYELKMNAGYVHNNLKYSDSIGKNIADGFAIPDGNVSIISYVDGVPIPNGIFPTTGYYDVTVTCTLQDGTKDYDMGNARWNGKKWLITIIDAPENTVCSADFVENANPYPVFTYMIDGVDYANDTSKVQLIKDGSGNWRIKFLESGTLKTSYPEKNSIDVFVVGGGGGGGSEGGTTNGGCGGGGGYTKTYKSLELNAGEEQYIKVGAGGTGGTGSGGTAGEQSYFGSTTYAANGGGFGCQMGSCNSGCGGSGGSGGGCGGMSSGEAPSAGSGGTNGTSGKSNVSWSTAGSGQGTTTREFGEATGDLYAGGGSGGQWMYLKWPNPIAGGAGGGGAGGGNNSAAQSGTPNTGGGGGGGTPTYSTTGISNSGGNGGSGIVIIRNHQ